MEQVQLMCFISYGRRIEFRFKCLYNSGYILTAFIENHVSYSDFAYVNRYGNYNTGRDKIEHIFVTVLECEDALVTELYSIYVG